MKLKKYAIRGLIAFAVVVALCMFFSGTIRTITTAKVKLLTPRQGKFSEQVELTGKVVFPAAEPVKLENAQGVSLTVTSVKVQPGSEVEEGDVLFTAEIADYEKNMDTLRQSYNEAAGQLADLERKNANLRLRPTDEAWAKAYTALAEAQNAVPNPGNYYDVSQIATSADGKYALVSGVTRELRHSTVNKTGSK